MIMHPGRARRTSELARLDPENDWHEIYKRLTLWEVPAEARLGFQLAFYRPFAVPRMAEVLTASGQFRGNAMHRAYDTGIVVHEIIYGGVDSDRGRAMIRLMNKMHDRPGICQEDLTYILTALIVVPTRLIDRLAWRRTTHKERAATCRFYAEMGRRMNIARLPASYAQAEAWFDAYEVERLAPSAAGTGLTAATVEALRGRMARPVRRYTAQLTSALLADRRLSWAVGLPPPQRALVRVLAAGAAVRKLIQRFQPPHERPSFWPGRPAGSIYPEGYRLDQLGHSGH